MEDKHSIESEQPTVSLLAALNRFERYERIRDQYGDDKYGYYNEPMQKSEELVLQYIQMPGVSSLIRHALSADVPATDETPGIVNRLASFMNSKGLLAEIDDPATTVEAKQDEIDSRIAADEFLSRGPDKVSSDLYGKKLVVGNTEVVITNVVPQYPAINKRYLKRPIFGQDRTDAFVSAFRGHSLLFLRAGDKDNTDCCVYVKGVTHQGTDYPSPSKVGEILGLPGDSVGDLELQEDTLFLKNIRPNPKSS